MWKKPARSCRYNTHAVLNSALGILSTPTPSIGIVHFHFIVRKPKYRGVKEPVQVPPNKSQCLCCPGQDILRDEGAYSLAGCLIIYLDALWPQSLPNQQTSERELRTFLAVKLLQESGACGQHGRQTRQSKRRVLGYGNCYPASLGFPRRRREPKNSLPGIRTAAFMLQLHLRLPQKPQNPS